MADKSTQDANPQKDPEDWVTGDEPATGPQKSYASTLAQQTGEEVDVDDLTKAQASEVIENLQDERDGTTQSGQQPTSDQPRRTNLIKDGHVEHTDVSD